MAYHEAGKLYRFDTSYVYKSDSASGRFLRLVYGLFSKNADRELRRRNITDIPQELVRSFPYYEIARTFSAKCLGPIITDYIWERGEHAFGKIVARSLNNKIKAVHGYEHGSLEVFRRAKEIGITTIYEMPAPFHTTVSRILDAEYIKYPETKTIHKKYTDLFTPQRSRRREEELRLADIILCNSSFTKRSLVEGGAKENSILVIPYGMPKLAKQLSEHKTTDKIIFIYAGTLSVRKGVHYLTEAWKNLRPSPNAELRLFGALAVPSSMIKSLPGNIRWNPTVTKDELFKQYQEADLLIFPTLCDGFGMVLTEALSNGCPVLTTSSAGSADFIKNGENGFVVSPGDSKAIAAVMRHCIDDAAHFRHMRESCLQTARSWQWSDYRKTVIDKIANRIQ
jgi:glycosyltransferase involved in cell wall biosynthesis